MKPRGSPWTMQGPGVAAMGQLAKADASLSRHRARARTVARAGTARQAIRTLGLLFLTLLGCTAGLLLLEPANSRYPTRSSQRCGTR